MNNAIQGNCKFAKMISCGNTNACTTCGWNPKVKEARVKQFMRDRANEMKKKPNQCPLRSCSILDQKRELGMTLNCFSPTCEMAPEGECKVFVGVMDFWMSKCNGHAVGLSKKVENAHEQPK